MAPRLLTSPGPAHTTITFLPNEYRGVVNSSGLAIYKGSMQEIIIVATESKNLKYIEAVNNGVNMDRGPVMFTSDVSLPKDDKSASEVNKSQLGNSQDYKCTAMLTMLQKKGRGSKAMGSTPR